MARPYAATNEEGTCLWCGRKLRPLSTAIGMKREANRARRVFSGAYLERRLDDLAKWHELMKNRIGRYHGCFDIEACASAFGFAMANAGYRLEPITKGKIAQLRKTH